MSPAEEFLDDLREIFTRVPWWVPLVVASAVGGAVLIFLPKPFSGLRTPFAGIAVFLILLPGIVAQFQKLDRRQLFERNQELEKIRQLSWQRFEELVAEVYRRRGYSAAITGGGGADGGVDVTLRREGEMVFVQCKHWKAITVDVSKARELLGVVAAKSADKGILITSGRFTPSAKQFAVGNRLDLIDGVGLVQLMRNITSGVTSADNFQPTAASQEVARESSPLCPRCNSEMVTRVASRGQWAGDSFWGCPTFPQCRGTRPMSSHVTLRAN
jgi:restriction system protein